MKAYFLVNDKDGKVVSTSDDETHLLKMAMQYAESGVTSSLYTRSKVVKPVKTVVVEVFAK